MRKTLLPFIHIWKFDIPTFGLLMCLAFVAAYFAFELEAKRRKLVFTTPEEAAEAERKRKKLVKIDPYSVVAYVAIAGILGAKLWHIIDTPADRPNVATFSSIGAALDWFRGGFAWFGGFLAGIATLLLLARRYGMNLLTMLDIASPAVAIGYAVGRIGCLISGDGDYGKPTTLPWGMAFPNGLVPTTQTCPLWGALPDCRVHPTPIYEFIIGMLIFWYLWRRGARAIRHPLAPGVITGEFLVMSGTARFLVEFIRINPRVFLGMSNAQVSALLTTLAGIILLVIVRRRFRKLDPVRKVFDHVTEHGNQETRPEYHRATAECPNPERWRMFDTMTAEVEVLEFLRCLMTTIKPRLVVETGTFLGVSTVYMAEGLKRNGSGKIITCEPDRDVFAKAKQKIDGSGLTKWVDYRCESSMDVKVPGAIDVLFCDSLPELREPEVRHFLPQINPNGVILMHDSSSHLKTVREAALRMENEGLISVVLLPTPRGLVMAQRREGRR